MKTWISIGKTVAFLAPLDAFLPISCGIMGADKFRTFDTNPRFGQKNSAKALVREIQGARETKKRLETLKELLPEKAR
ncbi:unnamed protein product [Rhizophagus irregularis]|nr:unnamed protein product [Rhizophagus irregularis]